MHELAMIDGFVATPDCYLWHEASATAIVADLHLGAEAELSRRGVFMPEVATAPLMSAWTRMCRRLALAAHRGTVVIAGDLFDSVTPDSSDRATARELMEVLPPGARAMVLLGNHDPRPEVLREIFDKVDVQIAQRATVGGYTIAHGDCLADCPVSGGVIVGHQHPAVVLRDRVQSAKMICFALAQKSKMILLPSFSRAPLGSNLLTEQHWIIDAVRPHDADLHIAGIVTPTAGPARVLDFGPLSGLRLPF